MTHFIRVASLLALLLGAVFAPVRGDPAQDPPEPALPTFKYEQHLLLPLRAHLLRAKTAAEANCALVDGDVGRILPKVNRAWAAAGIQFYLDSCLTEEAADQDLFAGMADDRTKSHLLLLRPRPSLDVAMFHVFYIHEMSPNGIFLRRDGIFVKETAKLRAVEGGIDEPLPRVTAHELGHGLGLDHRQDTYNLMASGTTGTSLNAKEVETARAEAGRLGWARSAEDLLQLAASARESGQLPAATAMDRCLAAIPGESPLKDAAAARLHDSQTR